MAIARRNLVDSETPGFYRCTNRCVRRTFFCGIVDETGQDYSHRKDWLERRIIGTYSIDSHLIANRSQVQTLKYESYLRIEILSRVSIIFAIIFAYTVPSKNLLPNSKPMLSPSVFGM